jgi:type IV secretion system protein VirB5
MKMNTLNVFRTPITEASFSAVYQAQQRDFSERYSIHEQNATRWRYIAAGCLAITALAVGGLVYDASLSKYVPYVVERDHLGDEVAVGPADKAAPCDPRVIQADINRWIFNVRTVSTDAQTQRHNIYEAYDHTDKAGDASGELNEWFQKHNPFKRAADEIVTTTVISTLPVDPHYWKTWRSSWREETRTRSGDPQGTPAVKEVSITVACKPPTTETDFKKNPSGVFVESFDWKN